MILQWNNIQHENYMRWDAGSDAFCIDRLDRCLFPGTRSCSLRWSSECDKGGARHRQVVANKSHFACKRSIVTVVTQSHEILRTHWLGWPLMTRAFQVIFSWFLRCSPGSAWLAQEWSLSSIESTLSAWPWCLKVPGPRTWGRPR